MPHPFYQVGDRTYQNKYLAWVDRCNTGQPIHWNFFESAFDQADWNQEPQTRWNDLLDMRARQIANLGRPIVLSYSGGTDSLTVYHALRRQQVPLAAVYTLIKRTPGDHHVKALEFIQQESQQHGFPVIVAHEDDVLYDKIYDRDEWFARPQNLGVAFGFGNDVLLHDELNPELSSKIGHDYVYVTGHEKPRIFYANGVFYSNQSDWTFQAQCDPRVEYFFTSPALPELHIKQSYMAARWIWCEHDRTGLDFDAGGLFGQVIKSAHYLDYAINGCGRVGDLDDTPMQKLRSAHSHLYLRDHHTIDKVHVSGNHKTMLMWGVANGKNWARRYINGLRLLRSDSVTGKMFRSQESFHDIEQFYSKAYALNMSYIQPTTQPATA